MTNAGMSRRREIEWMRKGSGSEILNAKKRSGSAKNESWRKTQSPPRWRHTSIR
jgi:hypothetical protein